MSPATHRGSGKCSRCSHRRFRLDGSGFEPQWRRNCLVPSPFHPCQGEHRAPAQSTPEVKRPGRGVDPPPHLALKLRMSKTIPLTPPPRCLHNMLQADLYLYLDLYLYQQRSQLTKNIVAVVTTGITLCRPNTLL